MCYAIASIIWGCASSKVGTGDSYGKVTMNRPAKVCIAPDDKAHLQRSKDFKHDGVTEKIHGEVHHLVASFGSRRSTPSRCRFALTMLNPTTNFVASIIAVVTCFNYEDCYQTVRGWGGEYGGIIGEYEHEVDGCEGGDCYFWVEGGRPLINIWQGNKAHAFQASQRRMLYDHKNSHQHRTYPIVLRTSPISPPTWPANLVLGRLKSFKGVIGPENVLRAPSPFGGHRGNLNSHPYSIRGTYLKTSITASFFHNT